MDQFKVVFVPRSRDDLASIVAFVSQRATPDIAERLGMQLIEKALTLQTFPERGRVVPELGDHAVREILFKTYRIVYRVRQNVIEVIRFWHAARGTPEIDSDAFSNS